MQLGILTKHTSNKKKEHKNIENFYIKALRFILSIYDEAIFKLHLS